MQKQIIREIMNQIYELFRIAKTEINSIDSLKQVSAFHAASSNRSHL